MTSMKRLASGAALAALLSGTGLAAHAQETTSAIHGVVTAAGAPAGSASITAIHTPSGTRAVTATDATGTFDLRGLRVGGPYTITVAAPGEAPKTYTDVFLEVSKTFNLDIDVAETSVEEVVVTGSAATNTEEGPKTVLGRDAIQSVVSVSRDPRDLARRDILVSQDLSGGRAGTNGGGLSIAGSNPRFNRIAVDGVPAQDNFGLAQGGMTTARGPVTLDAIEQFSVAAVPTDVENGDFIGGALNMVLRSGTNSFHGSLFDNYLNEGMVGRHLSDTRVAQVISQKNYGGFLSGPIWKDKLFFAVSYENYRTIDPTLYGVPGAGTANVFANGLTQATIDQITGIYNNGYASDYDLGGIPTTAPVTDKKYSAKIDWNISDRHRASLTYRRAESASYQRTDLGAATAALYSHWYQQYNRDEAITAEIHSNWTDALTTTLKATYRDYRNGQNPPGGQNFADVAVCAAPTSDATLTTCAAGFSQVRFGPDQFRAANSLDEQETRYQAQAEYTYQGHLFKVGVQARKADVFDLFVPQSHGLYYFDSIADFQAGRAGSLTYQNAVTGNPNDAAFNTTYWTYSAYAQDSLDITETLRVNAGFRFDYYDEPDRPILNPNFQARTGFSNQSTIDGLYVLMPRVSADWTPRDSLKFSAGFGLFSGGTPDVLTGAPFYNTGYATTSVIFQRTPTGITETTNTPGYTAAVGNAALSGLNSDPNFGFQPPSLVSQLQQGTLSPGGAAIPPLGEVIALAPTFQMPAQWKLFLSGSWEAPYGVRVGADLVATRDQNALTYYDYRAQPLVVNGVQQFLPDGRIRYDGLGAVAGKSSANLGSNRDIIVSNVDQGKSYTASFTLSKAWDFGLSAMFGYAHSKSRDVSEGLFFGTTAGSLYAGVPAGMDPNRDYLGRSAYDIGDRFKLALDYRHSFFGDNETRVSLFAERQDGRPFGFTMQDRASGRGPVFGVNRQAQLLYVPDFAADTNPSDLDVGIVHFATAQDLALFKKYVSDFNLPSGLVQKYSNTNAPIGRIDLSLSQELPTLIRGHKLRVQADIRNLANLINRDWGLVGEYSTTTTLARADCYAPGVGVVPTTSAACPAYQYSSVPTSVTKTRNTALSLWYMQVSLRYEF